jgi:hypothetical protein
LKDKANIKPLTYVPAGTRIIIYPNADLWLKQEKKKGDKAGKGSASGIPSKKVFIDHDAVTAENEQKAAQRQVVYDGESSGTPTASGGENGSKPLISSGTKGSNTSSSGALPPPPPPPPSSPQTGSSSSSSDGIPQLF